MFENLFKYPRVLARHLNAPFADLRERFLTHCADQKMAAATLHHMACELVVVAGRIDLTAGHQISLPEIEAAADQWSQYQRHRRRAHSPRWSRERFIQTAVSWIRFLERFQETERQVCPYAHVVQDFAAFMRDQRGLSEVTIRSRCWHVEKFLDWLKQENRSFGEVALEVTWTSFLARTEKEDGDVSLWPQVQTRCEPSSVTRRREAGVLQAWRTELKVQESSNKKLFP